MAIDNFHLWHASLRHPAGTIPLPEGEPCMCTYICETFVCFGTSLFVPARLPTTLKLRRHRKPVRNLSSRFELDPSTVARVAGSQKFFFRWERVSRFPGFLCMRPILYVRTGNFLSVFVALSLEHTAQNIYTTGRQQNIQRPRRYNAAAHKHQQATPCVCDTPVCAVLLWLQYSGP